MRLAGKVKGSCVVMLFFLLLILVIFREGWFQGLAIQGIDGNYSYLHLLRGNLLRGGGGWWDPAHWLGTGNSFGVNSVYLFLRLFPSRIGLLAGYTVMIFLSMVFTWLLLRRFQLDRVASVFGAMAFGLAPHFITLIYPGHNDCVHVPALASMLFYFLTAALDGRTLGRRSWLCVPAAGFGWGMMMNADVQRGLYFSVAAFFYALYLILRRGGFNKSDSSGKSAAERIRGLLVFSAIGLFALLIFAHNAQIQFGSELVSGRVSGIEEESPQVEAEKWAFATSWSFHPKELLDSFAPGYHGMISGDPERPYWGSRPVAHSNDGLGYFVLFFGLAGILAAFRRSADVRFFAIITLLATLLAFGEYWPGRPLFTLWYHLPMMAKMRAPVKFMSVAAFGLSILSAYGFQNLLEAIREQQRAELKRWLIGFGVLAGGAVFGILSATGGGSSFPSQAAQAGAIRALVWMSVFSLAGGALIAACFIKRPVPFLQHIAGFGFLFLLTFNLFQINRFYIKRSWFDPDEFYRPDEIVQFLQHNAGQNRVVCSLKTIYQERMVPLSLMATRDVYVTHLFQYFGIAAMEQTPVSRISNDYDTYFKALLPAIPQAASPEQFVRTLLDGQIRFWRLSGVKYVLTDGGLYGVSQQPVPVFELMQQHSDLNLCFTGMGYGGRRIAVFELKESLPLFRMVHSIELVPDRGSAMIRISRSDFDASNSVAVAEGDLPAGFLADNGTGAVHVNESRPGEVRLTCEVSAPALLLWCSRFDKGWKAFVNGQPVPLFPVNGIMTAAQINEGRHDIRLIYKPQFKVARLSFWVALCSMLFVPAAVWSLKGKDE